MGRPSNRFRLAVVPALPTRSLTGLDLTAMGGSVPVAGLIVGAVADVTLNEYLLRLSFRPFPRCSIRSTWVARKGRRPVRRVKSRLLRTDCGHPVSAIYLPSHLQIVDSCRIRPTGCDSTVLASRTGCTDCAEPATTGRCAMLWAQRIAEYRVA